MTTMIAFRDGILLQRLETPDHERPCAVCGVPGVTWEVVLPGVHGRGYPEAYCAQHEAEARTEFATITHADRR